MPNTNSRLGLILALLIAFSCLLAAVSWTASPPVALALLPTREIDPTPSPTAPPALPTATSSVRPGALIRLEATFLAGWPWEATPWSALWTVVQWQDHEGAWQDVVGWRGGLDDVTVAAGGAVVGVKTWWVAVAELGKGPFRWVVSMGETGDRLAIRLATSEPFRLPAMEKEVTTVEVVLSQP
jgi:hypothetical protein